jgi:plasmid stabilization system protein ParE
VSAFSVVLAPAAESDIEEAFHWYQERDAAAANSFRAETLEAIDQLAADPRRWRVDANGNRRRLLKRFPYSVWFEVTANTVTVLAIAHHRRMPGYWRV